mmetsp:Transcript_3887/g.6099  ORF Transcript_3887/g.6099 Transcript_3887/m.6099 type:complete len:455 (-) Transcript_3887:77-1441(-)
MEVPTVALQWVIQDVSSNVELANLTNVSKRWRQEVQSFITTYPNAMSSQLLLPSLAKHIIDGEGGDAFCATWLPPEGIQTVPVPSSPMEGSTNRSNHHPHMSSYGNNAYNRNHEIKKESFRDCCYEWRGYRTAHQILLPFGYSKKFVNKFVAEISCKEEEEKEDYQWTTSSVRGATYARPEAYCPCWDANSPSSNEFEKYSIRKRILHHRQQWLPRAIQSSPFKNPMQPLQRGQQQPSIQLLNASGSSAVRLLTPPFDCGPLAGPITLFCVAIATEDGCFLSGLTSKCEFGHLYPQTEAEHLIDRSPICVAMDGISDSTSSKNCRIEEEEEDDDDEEDHPNNDDADNDKVGQKQQKKKAVAATRKALLLAAEAWQTRVARLPGEEDHPKKMLERPKKLVQEYLQQTHTHLFVNVEKNWSPGEPWDLSQIATLPRDLRNRCEPASESSPFMSLCL